VFNLQTASTYTLTPSAGSNGSITPSSVVTVNSGGSQIFTITPNSGYQVASVTVDGVSVGALSSYTFSSVTANHTINATFVLAGACPSNTICPATGDNATIQNAINSASEGQTILVPAGTWNWVAPVNLSKGVHLKGAGAGGFLGDSSTSVSIGTGDKTFTTQSGKNYQVGETITAVYKANGNAKNMTGTVKSYSGTSLVLSVNSVLGTGTYSAWAFVRPAKTIVKNDYSNNWNVGVLSLNGNANTSQYYPEVSGIYFDGGKAESCKNSTGDKCGGVHVSIGGNLSTNPVLIHDNRFSARGDMGRAMAITANRGVIYRNSFDNGICASTYAGCWPTVSQAMVMANESNTYSWTTKSTMGMDDIGGINNSYVEDNYFLGYWQSTIDFDSNSRSVARYNIFDNSAVGTHGADTSLNGLRHYEVYNNKFIFNNIGDDTYQLPWWFYNRGGTGVIADNEMPNISSQAWGDKGEMNFTVMNLRRAYAQFPCWGADTTAIERPAPRQIGYGYVTGTGGLDPKGIYRGDPEPLYIWGNIGNPSIGLSDYSDYNSDGTRAASMCQNSILDSTADYVRQGYEYKLEQKPGYTKYTYPHPITIGR
jgi:hypothetical protein